MPTCPTCHVRHVLHWHVPLAGAAVAGRHGSCRPSPGRRVHQQRRGGRTSRRSEVLATLCCNLAKKRSERVPRGVGSTGGSHLELWPLDAIGVKFIQVHLLIYGVTPLDVRFLGSACDICWCHPVCRCNLLKDKKLREARILPTEYPNTKQFIFQPHLAGFAGQSREGITLVADHGRCSKKRS